MFEADPGAHTAKIAVMLGHASQMFDDAAGHQAEIAGVEGKTDIGEPGHQAIEKEIAGAQEQRLLAANALGVDDVIAFSESLKELRDGFRKVLEVAIHDDRGFAIDVIESRTDGGLMAIVSGEGNHDDAGILGGGLLEEGERGIGAAVIGKDDLVRAAGESVENGAEAAEEFGQDLFFVVNRNGDGEARRRIHALYRTCGKGRGEGINKFFSRNGRGAEKKVGEKGNARCEAWGEIQTKVF